MCPTSQSPFFKSTELTQQKRITHFATADQLPSPAVASEVARAAGIHVSTGSCRLDRLERFFCRNQYVCFRVRRGTCVAVGRYASGDVAYEWGACWVNLASARFRLESPRWFWGSSLNRQGRRQKGSRVRELPPGEPVIVPGPCPVCEHDICAHCSRAAPAVLPR
jgi:hypothetical protein